MRSYKNIDYHVHGLTQDNIESYENICKDNFHRTRQVPSQILEGEYLRKQLDKGLKGKNKWKVVTLVREPIARNISSFFQILKSVLGYDYKNKIEYMKTEDIIEELIDLFLEQYIDYENEKSLTWFDRQLKPVLDIDVYSKEFSKSKGYEIYESECAELLLLRLENLNECARDAFKKFLGINEFTLIPENIGSSKSYRNIYRRFLDSIVLPESYIDKMYTSKYMRHFYSEEETEAFKVKWRKQNPTGSATKLLESQALSSLPRM